MCIASLLLNWGSIPRTLVNKKLRGRLSLYTSSGGLCFKKEAGTGKLVSHFCWLEEEALGCFLTIVCPDIELAVLIEGIVCCLWGFAVLESDVFKFLSLVIDVLLLVLDPGVAFWLLFEWVNVICLLTLGVELLLNRSSLQAFACPAIKNYTHCTHTIQENV